MLKIELVSIHKIIIIFIGSVLFQNPTFLFFHDFELKNLSFDSQIDTFLFTAKNGHFWGSSRLNFQHILFSERVMI